MTAAQSPEPEGQLANVSVVLVVSAPTPVARENARLLARLFEDVVIVSGETSLGEFGRVVDPASGGSVAAGLEAAREDRVLVVMSSDAVPAELVLGLTAWPEYECVAPVRDGRVEPGCALVQRKAALESLDAQALSQAVPLDALMKRLEASAIEGQDLAALLGAKTALS